MKGPCCEDLAWVLIVSLALKVYSQIAFDGSFQTLLNSISHRLGAYIIKELYLVYTSS